MRAARQRRLPLAQLLFAAAGVAVLLVCGAYVLRFVSATTFHQERAFRVLEEIGSQLDSLQRTLSNQLRLMPPELAGSQCAKELAKETPGNGCKEKREVYQRRLALQGPKVGAASLSEELFKRACSQTSRYAVTLRSHEPGVPFVAFACDSQLQPGKPGQLLTVAFQGSLAETLQEFVSQSFFDEVLIALGDGTVIATVPRQVESRTTGVQLHPAKVSRLGITNATSLLRQGNATPAEKAADKQPAGLPEQPTVFASKIANDEYRVFVRAVQPRYGTYLQPDEGAAVRQERVFLVGLKREDLRSELASSMEPGGRFLLTILTLLAFLVWPLATLRSKPPDDPIAWSEAVACLAAVVLIPAVLAIATVWVWSYQGLLAWVDTGAARYAQEVATTLERQLRQGRGLLSQYQSLYRRDTATTVEPVEVAIRARGDAEFVTGRLGPSSCSKDQPDRTCIVDVTAAEAGQWRAWSTFSSVFATDARGARDGVRYTVYDPPLVKSDASYDAREYFRALQQHRGWTVTNKATGKRESYVAQRIFSGSDGARVLQIAVPRLEAPNCSADFCGIITGSASLHSLAAAVSPPLLNFAVIDRNSGMVVFHTNDSRSLAENFFVETESNPQLLALSSVAQSGFFSGRYMGAGHRFFHLPIQDTPWSVVVFFSLKEVGDLPWHSVFTALAAYAGALLVLLAGCCLALWLWAKRSRKSALNIAAGFWMRGGSSCSYARWGLALFAIGLSLVTVYELLIDAQISQISLITYFMWAVLALATAAVWLQHKFAIHSVCIALWLLLVSGLPAGWMALGYHDVQVQGLLRDGLVGAAHDIQRRNAVIAGDLQRWLSAAKGRAENFPEVWELTRPSAVMPVPGYLVGSCEGAGEKNVWAMCMFDAPPLATLITRRALDFWRRETWDASVQAETQQRRIRLLGQMDSYPRCKSKGGIEQCVFLTSDAEEFTVRAQAASAKSAAGSKDDDRRFAGVVGSLGSIVSPLLAILVTWMLSLFISRRLLGERSLIHTHRAKVGPPVSTHHGVVFHTRRIAGEEVDQLLRGLRQGGDGASTAITRVNLATKALYDELGPERMLEGRVLLTNLDIALADAARRRDILDALERLVENPHVQLLILCRRSPIERLYHPERYPESGSEHVLALEESLRWDNVLQKFECRNIENMDAPRTHPHLATVDHHRTWKLCTRSERLLLYELARGRLANPRNIAVIDALLARGLLKLDPWPKIADESFETFVRTAETTDDLAQWQRDAAQSPGRRVRSTIIAILLVALLLTVVWFSWSAGDKFKIVSAIVAGSVAFLGQIGQAFNFVRTGAGSGGRPGG